MKVLTRSGRQRFCMMTTITRGGILALGLLGLSIAAKSQVDVGSQVRVLIDKGQLTKALEILDGQAKINRRDPDILYLHGYVLYRLDQLEPAKLDLKSAWSKAPSKLQSSYILGRIAQQQEHPIEAIRWLQPCALSTPPIDDSIVRLGQLYWRTGQMGDARHWTEKAMAQMPWDGSLHYRLGRIYQQLGEPELARHEFAESANAKTADSEGVQQLMECSQALEKQDSATALRIRREFLDRPSLDPDLLVALGTSFAAAGAPDQALELYRSAAGRDPMSYQANFNLGLALLNVGQANEAVVPLEASLQLAPESKQANATLALAYVAQGKFKEAVPSLEAARQSDPNDQKIAGLLSLAYSRSGELPKAISILRKSIESVKDDPKLYFLLVECLNATEKQDEALAVADEAVKRFPTLAKSWLGKAQQEARLGHYHEAGPMFAKAAELAPEQVEPLLGLAEAQQKDGDYQGALATYQKAISKDGDITAELGAAKSLIFLGRVTEARTVLEQSAATNENNSQVHVELSRVYARLGEQDLVREQTRIVQRLRAAEDEANRNQPAP